MAGPRGDHGHGHTVKQHLGDSPACCPPPCNLMCRNPADMTALRHIFDNTAGL
jgi:hypothetical protein